MHRTAPSTMGNSLVQDVDGMRLRNPTLGCVFSLGVQCFLQIRPGFPCPPVRQIAQSYLTGPIRNASWTVIPHGQFTFGVCWGFFHPPPGHANPFCFVAESWTGKTKAVRFQKYILPPAQVTWGTRLAGWCLGRLDCMPGWLHSLGRSPGFLSLSLFWECEWRSSSSFYSAVVQMNNRTQRPRCASGLLRNRNTAVKVTVIHVFWLKIYLN